MPVVELKRPPVKPDADVVKLCKHLLEQAERGEIRAVAVAVDLAEDCTVATMAYANGARSVALLGAVQVLNAQVLELCRRNTE